MDANRRFSSRLSASGNVVVSSSTGTRTSRSPAKPAPDLASIGPSRITGPRPRRSRELTDPRPRASRDSRPECRRGRGQIARAAGREVTSEGCVCAVLAFARDLASMAATTMAKSCSGRTRGAAAARGGAQPWGRGADQGRGGGRASGSSLQGLLERGVRWTCQVGAGALQPLQAAHHATQKVQDALNDGVEGGGGTIRVQGPPGVRESRCSARRR